MAGFIASQGVLRSGMQRGFLDYGQQGRAKTSRKVPFSSRAVLKPVTEVSFCGFTLPLSMHGQGDGAARRGSSTLETLCAADEKSPSKGHAVVPQGLMIPLTSEEKQLLALRGTSLASGSLDGKQMRNRITIFYN